MRSAKMESHGVGYGHWSRFKECPKGEFICGLKTRVEDPNHDDTGLNDIIHQCCKPVVKKRKRANWMAVQN